MRGGGGAAQGAAVLAPGEVHARLWRAPPSTRSSASAFGASDDSLDRPWAPQSPVRGGRKPGSAQPARPVEARRQQDQDEFRDQRGIAGQAGKGPSQVSQTHRPTCIAMPRITPQRARRRRRLSSTKARILMDWWRSMAAAMPSGRRLTNTCVSGTGRGRTAQSKVTSQMAALQ